MSSTKPRGFVTITLHSHLPYVINHGTWPHGLEWLLEAAAETYLPLLRTFQALEDAGTALKANINLSPILLEQLNHPKFKEEFPAYLKRKVDAARKDQEMFRSRGDEHLRGVAEYWEHFFAGLAEQFEAIDRDIIKAYKGFYDSGAIEIITCGATHGYFPLLGTDASIRAQVKLGVQIHEKFFGRKPRGIWLPECGYRPAGSWRMPIAVAGNSHGDLSRTRAGIEEILAENGIEYFFVDATLLEQSVVSVSPYELMNTDVLPDTREQARTKEARSSASFYYSYFAGLPKAPGRGVAFFTRDPHTASQVWSGKHGYPGDGVYLEFHKKHWPGGHQYWQVTDSELDLGLKTPYYPDVARERTREHALHFVSLCTEALSNHLADDGVLPVLSAPFDAELFGHWWFEGPEWLKNVALEFARPECPLSLTTCGEYLDKQRPTAYLAIPEGSWGKNGTNEVWLNPDTSWTWGHIYASELAVEKMIASDLWRNHPKAARLAKQICRELLLLESSDWQFLITAESARDYAELRFTTHLDQFNKLMGAWKTFESTHEIGPQAAQDLESIEQRDSIFAGLTPDLYR